MGTHNMRLLGQQLAFIRSKKDNTNVNDPKFLEQYSQDVKSMNQEIDEKGIPDRYNFEVIKDIPGALNRLRMAIPSLITAPIDLTWGTVQRVKDNWKKDWDKQVKPWDRFNLNRRLLNNVTRWGYNSGDGRDELTNSLPFQIGSRFINETMTTLFNEGDMYKGDVFYRDGEQFPNEFWVGRQPTTHDMLALYLGVPQKYNSFMLNDQRPTRNDTVKDVYWKSVHPTMIDELIEGLPSWRADPNYYKQFGIDPARYNSIISRPASEQLIPKRAVSEFGGSSEEGVHYSHTGLGQFSANEGKDKYGNYLSVYDILDYNPFDSLPLLKNIDVPGAIIPHNKPILYQRFYKSPGSIDIALPSLHSFAMKNNLLSKPIEYQESLVDFLNHKFNSKYGNLLSKRNKYNAEYYKNGVPQAFQKLGKYFSDVDFDMWKKYKDNTLDLRNEKDHDYKNLFDFWGTASNKNSIVNDSVLTNWYNEFKNSLSNGYSNL